MERKLKRKPKVEYYKDLQGGIRWRVTGGNGEIIGSSSEGFDSIANAEKNMELLWNAFNDIFKDGQ